MTTFPFTFAASLMVLAALFLHGCASPTTRAEVATQTPAAVEPLPEAEDHLIDVWLVPVAGFPEERLAGVVRRLGEDLPWLQVRVAPAVARPADLFFAEHDQVVAQKALNAFRPTARGLPKTKSNTASVFLIAEDLNLEDRRLRFTFSVNDSAGRIAVVSTARLTLGDRKTPATPELVQARLYKLVKRQVAELRLGLSRTSHTTDLMYSPLMGLDDLDRIETEF